MPWHCRRIFEDCPENNAQQNRAQQADQADRKGNGRESAGHDCRDLPVRRETAPSVRIANDRRASAGAQLTAASNKERNHRKHNQPCRPKPQGRYPRTVHVQTLRPYRGLDGGR